MMGPVSTLPKVMSKEFWMADENCKECFHCQEPFTAFRRKHHCRTCGCIFDSKCTTNIPGEKFGVPGTLRVCKNCLQIINQRHDSDSEDSGDDIVLPPSFFRPQPAKSDTASTENPSLKRSDAESFVNNTENDTPGPVTTPMMAIPATRRLGDSANRKSAILEIDAPPLSRPSSSRSLKGLTSSRPSSTHNKAFQPRQNFLNRFRSTASLLPPFHQSAAADQLDKRPRLPAFHDDNIIDPDLAPYMSDDESSGDEQMSIFTALNSNGNLGTSLDVERSAFGSLMTSGRKHRSRMGEKSTSAVSFAGRNMDEGSRNSHASFSRPNRRRNLSTSSNNMFMLRGSPKPNKGPSTLNGFIEVGEEASGIEETPVQSSSSSVTRVTRSAAMKDGNAPAVELNGASLRHVRRLLRQLLQDAEIPNVRSWEKALMPILLQCTDDVNPDVRRGDDIDIRHYVKLKKIPGGRPGDTSYVSGVVFTKNLALKSMPRSISHPRIVIITFPIEYQRHQQHFMSLDPVIAQEKDFLRNMVNRIASLRPDVVFVQNHIAGLALQYLAEANIAVVYNVKQSVIEAVSRFAQTEIISSIDMVALKPVNVGKSAGFDVKTYVHKDIPNRKKTCIYVSGCPKELGCTIVLRGAPIPILTKMKRITEFMVYVVYNLKLETCLMRDEFVLIPSVEDDDGAEKSNSTSSSQTFAKRSSEAERSSESKPSSVENSSLRTDGDGPPIDRSVTSESKATSVEDSSQGPAIIDEVPAKLVSAHQSHAGEHSDGELPEDIPMPTFYSDMVAKHQTKILSASPFVKFTQPYLLMNAREQERKLVYLKRLRDQDTFEEKADAESSRPEQFQLIQPEMVHETVKGAPKKIMEVLHAVHDAEYDKALHNYQTQKRQWENYIQGNLNLFDPYSHQNIVVLYTLVCTESTVPCWGPEITAMSFYSEHETSRNFSPDCTLGQYVEDLCLTADSVCAFNGCEKRMTEHHRTYVHGEARITVFIEKMRCKMNGLQDSILMWSYCKICKKETQVFPMSDSTWKYSLGKYLELSFWSTELKLRANFCPHDLHRDHLRYFGFKDTAIRIHYDPIDLLEIVVPRSRVTWKVDNDLRLKNSLFTKTEDSWNRFMATVKSRINGINLESIVPEKAEACKAEVENLRKRAEDEHSSMLRKLQDKYMLSKYYEVIPMNRAIRAMQEKVAEWDAAFADFDYNYFPSEKDIGRLATAQLKSFFLEKDSSSSSLVQNDISDHVSDADEKHEDLPDQSADGDAISKIPVSLEPVVEEKHDSLPESDEKSAPPSAGDVVHTDVAADANGPPEVEVKDIPTASDPPESMEASGSTQTLDKSQSESLDSCEQGASPNETTLSEKILQLRKSNQAESAESSRIGSDLSGIPRPSNHSNSRFTGTTVSPPISRIQSQTTIATRRLPMSTTKSASSRDSGRLDGATSDGTGISGTADYTKEKRLSERLGISSSKANRKQPPSLIPRSVQARPRDFNKVSALAKHFEQLSREFEKERLRDRKQRAAKVTQSRGFPKATSKPIVEVYRDFKDAVEERTPSLEEADSVHQPNDASAPNTSMTASGSSDAHPEPVHDQVPQHSDQPQNALKDEPELADKRASPSEPTMSDDEAVASDAEHSLLEDMPPSEISESLGVSEAGSEVDLPKHEKISIMRVLTNFWAERSASGWTQLDYPFNVTDHVFVDSDVIVREDEPSSLIAFALDSDDYIGKLETIRQHDQSSPGTSAANEAEVEASLLRATGTHLKYQFVEGTCKMLCKIFYAEQFDAVRRKCGVADRFVESLSRCQNFESKGGKTKAVFLKTLDERFVMKSLSPIETQAFLTFAPAYFSIMAEALFHELPTVIAKMVGFYQIIIKNPATGTDIKWDVLVMENLFYDRANLRIFDLKGSMRNRKIQSTGEQNEVLLDENMVEFIYESPLFAREHSKKLLKASVWNDTLFLSRQNVMDYSLMVAVDEARKELVVGIIDCIRTYTWDKKLESWIKDRGFAGGNRNRPTVTSPKEYKSRFREAMDRYVLQAPNCWHHFVPETRSLKPE